MHRVTLCLLLSIISCSANSYAQSAAKRSDSVGLPKLFQAIRKDDLALVENLLGSNVDVNAHYDNYSALMIAAKSGSVSGMQMLIDHGAKINDVNSEGVTAVWMAIPDYDKTKFLLDYGADAKALLKNGSGLAEKLVCFPGTTRVLDLLLARGTELSTCPSKNDMLYAAAGTGDSVLTGRLLTAGFNPNDSVRSGDLPLLRASMLHCAGVVRQLVAHGADVNRAVKSWSKSLFAGVTPLMMAAFNGDKSSVSILLQNGADVNARSVKGWTALMMFEMADTNPEEVKTELLKYGADQKGRAAGSSNVFYYASQKISR